MRRIMLLLVLNLVGVLVFAQINNPDKPIKGEWNFKLQKVWSLNRAGDQPFAWIHQVLVSDGGGLYVFERKNKINYIFSSDGKYKGSFGKKGEGPGEARMERGLLYCSGKIIIDDRDRLHYFDAQGKYLNTIINKNAVLRPFFFLDPDRYIAAPKVNLNAVEGKGQIYRVDVKSQEKTMIREFSLFKGGTIREGENQFSLHIPELTPAIVIAGDNDRLYYGMSDLYTIHMKSMQGKQLGYFILEGRAKKPVPSSHQLVKNLLKNVEIKIPEALIDRIVKTLPKVNTYFTRVEIHNRSIYVYISDIQRKNIQQIDIFSKEGKYLYRAFIRVKPGLTIRRDPVMDKNHIYLVLEDEQGDIFIDKYKTLFPGR